MKKGISKKKICISLDIDVYNKLEKICDETDAKISTKINSLLKKSIIQSKKKSKIIESSTYSMNNENNIKPKYNTNQNMLNKSLNKKKR